MKHHDLSVVQVFPTEFIHLHSKEDYPLYPTGDNSGDQSLIDFYASFHIVEQAMQTYCTVLTL